MRGSKSVARTGFKGRDVLKEKVEFFPQQHRCEAGLGEARQYVLVEIWKNVVENVYILIFFHYVPICDWQNNVPNCGQPQTL